MNSQKYFTLHVRALETESPLRSPLRSSSGLNVVRRLYSPTARGTLHGGNLYNGSIKQMSELSTAYSSDSIELNDEYTRDVPVRVSGANFTLASTDQSAGTQKRYQILRDPIILRFHSRTKCYSILFFHFFPSRGKRAHEQRRNVCYRICYSITRTRHVRGPVASLCWRAVIAIDSSPPKAKSRINR